MTTWRYSVTVGLRGCYMPNAVYGPYSGTTRNGLADLIRNKLIMLDQPKRKFHEVHIKRLWQFIKNQGSSIAHFSIDIGNGEELAFHGLTLEEFRQLDKEDM